MLDKDVRIEALVCGEVKVRQLIAFHAGNVQRVLGSVHDWRRQTLSSSFMVKGECTWLDLLLRLLLPFKICVTFPFAHCVMWSEKVDPQTSFYKSNVPFVIM